MTEIKQQQTTISTDNQQSYTSIQEKKEKRVTGPGTVDYHTDKLASYKKQEPVVEKAPLVQESALSKALNYLNQLNPFNSESKELEKSLRSKVKLLKKEIEEDSKHANHPLNHQLLMITEQIEEELEQKPNWVRLELLVRQLALIVEQRVSQNDLESSQELRNRVENTIANLKKTYNSIGKVCIALVESSISLIGGAIGVSAGLNLTNMGLKTAQAITSGTQALSSGVRPFGQMTDESNASSRQGLEHEKQKRYQQKSQVDELRRNSENSKSRKKSEADNTIREDNEAKKQMLRTR